MEGKNKFIVYKGDRYYLNKGYYIYTERLHRRIWKDAYGEIPEGCHIHHKNGDSTDNRLENLECIGKREHHLMHFDREKQLGILHSKEISEKAHRWHKTKGAKKLLGNASKKQWKNRKPIRRICTVCSIEFETLNFAGTKYCSQKCRTKAGYWASLVEMKCVICGSTYKAQKNRGKTCSPKCAGMLSSKTKRGNVNDSVSATYG